MYLRSYAILSWIYLLLDLHVDLHVMYCNCLVVDRLLDFSIEHDRSFFHVDAARLAATPRHRHGQINAPRRAADQLVTSYYVVADFLSHLLARTSP